MFASRSLELGAAIMKPDFAGADCCHIVCVHTKRARLEQFDINFVKPLSAHSCAPAQM